MQYRWGPFQATVEDRNGSPAATLRRDGQPVSVPENAARLLALLLASPGATVSAADVVRGVWRQEPSPSGINEENVRVLVVQLRKFLDDDGTTQRHVQTVVHRGYRLVGVTTVQERRSLLPAAAVVAAAAAVLGTAAIARHVFRTAEPALPTPHTVVSSLAPPVTGAAPVPSRPASTRPRRTMEPAPAASAVLRPAAAPITDVAVPAAETARPPATPAAPDAVATAAPAPETRPRPELCPRLEALVTRLADQEALMHRLCASGDVGGVLNASGAAFDLAGLAADLHMEIGALAPYERQVGRFLPVGREAEAARAVRAECRDLRGGRSLWRLGWTAVRARADELRAAAACPSEDTR